MDNQTVIVLEGGNEVEVKIKPFDENPPVVKERKGKCPTVEAEKHQSIELKVPVVEINLTVDAKPSYVEAKESKILEEKSLDMAANSSVEVKLSNVEVEINPLIEEKSPAVETTSKASKVDMKQLKTVPGKPQVVKGKSTAEKKPTKVLAKKCKTIEGKPTVVEVNLLTVEATCDTVEPKKKSRRRRSSGRKIKRRRARKSSNPVTTVTVKAPVQNFASPVKCAVHAFLFKYQSALRKVPTQLPPKVHAGPPSKRVKRVSWSLSKSYQNRPYYTMKRGCYFCA